MWDNRAVKITENSAHYHIPRLSLSSLSLLFPLRLNLLRCGLRHNQLDALKRIFIGAIIGAMTDDLLDRDEWKIENENEKVENSR